MVGLFFLVMYLKLARCTSVARAAHKQTAKDITVSSASSVYIHVIMFDAHLEEQMSDKQQYCSRGGQCHGEEGRCTSVPNSSRNSHAFRAFLGIEGVARAEVSSEYRKC
jgi:hypothetical protein